MGVGALVFAMGFSRGFSGVNPVNHPREWDCFSYVIDAAEPGDTAFEAHAETAVWDAAVAECVEVPFVFFSVDFLFFDAFF